MKLIEASGRVVPLTAFEDNPRTAYAEDRLLQNSDTTQSLDLASGRYTLRLAVDYCDWTVRMGGDGIGLDQYSVSPATWRAED